MRQAQSSQKKAIKEIIVGQLKDKELEQISLSDNKHKIFWEEEGKEFSLNGEMFDVVKKKVVNGKTILLCINDKIEQALLDKYNSITKHNSSSDKKAKIGLENSIQLFVYEYQNGEEQYFTSLFSNHSLFEFNLTKNVTAIFSPPPEA
jgi:hypothetical protein